MKQLQKLLNQLEESIELPTTLKEAKKFSQNCKHKLLQIIKDGNNQRKQHLIQLTYEYTMQNKIKPTNSIKQILKAEELKNIWSGQQKQHLTYLRGSSASENRYHNSHWDENYQRYLRSTLQQLSYSPIQRPFPTSRRKRLILLRPPNQ